MPAKKSGGYSKPALRERIKREVMAGSKGGRAGQWSARKAQLVAQRYEKAGGGYTRGKSASQRSLSKWTGEEWGTKSGRKSSETGERYLPKKAREALSSREYAATTRKKREDTRKGRQFSKQPKSIAKKTARYR
jgi:hypothetical protein